MSASKSLGWAHALVLWCVCCSWGMTTLAQTPIDDVTQRLKQDFDKPENPLQVDRVSVMDEWAVASWVQGTRGGRALLRSHHGQWEIVLCGGDPLTDAGSLVEMGVPREWSEALARKVRENEQSLSPARRALFGSFNTIVHMDSHGEHPKVPHD
jgi:hypothetical protein